MDVIHVVGPRIGSGGSALHAPVHQELSVLVEFRDARAVVTVRDEQGAVRQPGKKRRPVEMRAVRAFYGGRADGLHELLHVMREDVNGVHVIVHDPDVFFGIVGIDRHVVRAA